MTGVLVCSSHTRMLHVDKLAVLLSRRLQPGSDAMQRQALQSTETDNACNRRLISS